MNPRIFWFVRLERSVQTPSAYANSWIVGLVPGPDATITCPARAATRTPPAKAADKAAPTKAPVDLNRATYEELQTLPGVGPKLAERIISRRPFGKVDELEAVPGIGPKTVERLRPLVRVDSTAP